MLQHGLVFGFSNRFRDTYLETRQHFSMGMETMLFRLLMQWDLFRMNSMRYKYKSSTTSKLPFPLFEIQSNVFIELFFSALFLVTAKEL